MGDVRGDVLRPPHCITPAAEKANKNQKRDPLRASFEVRGPDPLLNSFQS